MPAKQETNNPWGVTRAEAEVMDVLCDRGETMHVVANRLAKSWTTVNDHLKSVYRKMEVNRMLVACIQWDRWRRSGEGAEWRPPLPSTPARGDLVGAGRFARRGDGSWYEVHKVCADAPGVVTLYHGPDWPASERAGQDPCSSGG